MFHLRNDEDRRAMRLDDYDPDINVEDQRGQGGGGFGFGGGGGGGGLLLGLLPMVGSRFGCGGIALVLIAVALFGGLGNLGGSLTGGSQRTGSVETRGGNDTRSSCNLNAASRTACNAFSSADHTWTRLFQASGQRFEAPKLVFYDRNGQSGCGAAQSAMGPFYCPTDRGIYLDTSFFDELQTKFQAGGDFAQDYVVAHEFGHHIQNLLGTSDRVANIQRSAGRAEGNAASVRLELQADCYAGVWANANRDRLDPGDVEEGLRAAHQIGDDTLEAAAGQRPVPESFTHGTSEQRMHWLKVGLDSGDPARCDTFSGAI